MRFLLNKTFDVCKTYSQFHITTLERLQEIQEKAKQLLPADTALSALPSNSLVNSNDFSLINRLVDTIMLKNQNGDSILAKKSPPLTKPADLNVSNQNFKDLICQICKRKFTSSAKLIKHTEIHKEEKIFKCSFCSYKYFRLVNLNKHLELNHKSQLGENRSNANLDVIPIINIEINKNKDEHFKCHFCNKSFRTNTLLTIHMRVHNKEQPYECVVCNRKFSQKCNLKKHERRKHDHLIKEGNKESDAMSSQNVTDNLDDSMNTNPVLNCEENTIEDNIDYTII